MKKFDTKVQYLKYKVLREVARDEWEGKLQYTAIDIPMRLSPGKVSTMRCCIYKERAILGERVKLAMGGDRENPNVIEVIDIACDECPSTGYDVTSSCRGCLSHRCKEVCKHGAISFDENHVAHIDKSKCVECGQCARVCPFSAIINLKRPCQIACKIKAISINENKAATIDNSKCISCGACVYQCPFGAISDKSYILEVVDIIKNSDNNQKYKTYAVVAPSIGSQFSYAKIGQVIAGLKQMGFYSVVEAALGADLVAHSEAMELAEKGFLTSSCCPSFVDYVEKFFPDLTHYVSHNPSPMVEISKRIKGFDPTAKVVFIGPCTSKKMEYKKDGAKEYVDSVITFEELQALYDSKDIDISTLQEEPLDQASYFGRIFARSGGLSDAVAQAFKEENTSFEVDAVVCDGIEECRSALLRKSKHTLNANFIEGMACANGCIGGAGCLTHGEKHKNEVDKYGKEATEKTISGAVASLKISKE